MPFFSRWGVVIHGGIDGYSRMITFLQASDNNFAQTVGLLFVEATGLHGLPSRIRTDRGGENVIAGRIMENIRGENRGSWLRGPSVHNQRIERLWRDLRQFCTNFYIELFYRLENMMILNPDIPSHLFALHYVFLPRLNWAITEFVLAYNNHRVRTMNNRTPKQMYFSGLISGYNSNYLHVREILNSTNPVVDWNEYAIEGDGVRRDEGEHTIVNFPRPSLGLTQENYTLLLQGLRTAVPDVCAHCNDHDIGYYTQTFLYIQNFLSEREIL